MNVPHDFADEATEFQAQPAGADEAAMLAAGARLGPFAIRRLLGEGGMGRVYLAEQLHPVRRDVALKLIREQVASPLARAWFDVERQALAQMQHPAIAQVFDAGTTAQGNPYLAMEVVEGEPITAFCRRHKVDRAETLALFARVCHGVQHAHQKGIIHRDLKPSNVLVRRVDGVAMPKIIDFGIAVGGGPAAAGASVDMAATERAGTAVYMSPEQAGREHRDLDTRSDVYSLGVMLYEVLTGGDAAELATRAHLSLRAPHVTLLAAIDSGDGGVPPPAPTALLQAARRLPSELRAILRKALAADRDARYESAAALAEDLDRFRERRPVKALPQTRLYLARTFAARHRLGLAAATLAAAALLAGTALAVHGMAQARESAALARVEAAKAAQTADFVRGMLAGIDPDRAQGMDRQLMRLVLDSAAERAGRELAGQPAVRASIERTIADTYASLGELVLAGSHYDAALAIAAAAGLTPAEQARLALRAAQNIANQGKPQDAVAAAQDAFAQVAALPEDDRDRLFIEAGLAGIEADAGEVAEARVRLLRVLALQRRTLGNEHPETLTTIDSLAMADSTLARFDEGRPLFEELIAHYRARHGEENSKTLGAINGLAVLELEQKHFAEAEKLLAPQLPVFERVFGPGHPLTLRVVTNLGGAIRQQGRNEEARPYYERALALSRTLFGEATATTVVAEINLALLLRDAGDLDGAEHHARAAVTQAAVAFRDSPMRGIMYRELGSVLILRHDYAAAEGMLDKAWDILAGASGFGPAHPRSQDVVDSYVSLYAAWHKPALEARWRARRNPVASTTP